MRTRVKSKALKKTRRKNKTLMQRVVFIGKIILVLAFLSFLALIYASRDAIFRNFYDFTAKLGFVVTNIKVRGQKHISDEQIIKLLKIKKGNPIMEVSLPDLKQQLEKIDWIKNVNIQRQLPDTIDITITERIPIALGQKDSKLHVIDEEGVVINEKNLAPYAKLPIIIGEGAELYANSLIKILKTDLELFKSINSIIRVSEHRWNIRFYNDLEIKLPEHNVEKAWNKVIRMYKDKMLFLPENAVIDLRIANKIFIEKR